MSTESNSIDVSLQSSEAKLVKDLTRIVGDADELLKELADTSSDEFSLMRERFAARLHEARRRVDEARIELARKARHAVDAADEYIRENPWKVTALVSLVGVGVLAAGLLLRRSASDADRVKD